MKELPSLVMLRAFETVARHGSMSRAAKELNVTHGAVSRQISSLERLLEVQLLRRRARGVQLTEEGQTLFHGLSWGFERIRTAVAGLYDGRQKRSVSIATLPTVASRWLMPRLTTFRARHPDITINIRTRTELDDLADPAIDFAIRYGTGTWPNTKADLLFSASAYPVCSPAFLTRHGPFDGAVDLLRHPLIHDTSRHWWMDWFLAAGLQLETLNGGIVVDEYGLAIQFALDGHGIALARDPLLDRELSAGALVRLFDVSVIPRFAYYLARDAGCSLSHEAELLVNWLMHEGRRNSL